MRKADSYLTYLQSGWLLDTSSTFFSRFLKFSTLVLRPVKVTLLSMLPWLSLWLAPSISLHLFIKYSFRAGKSVSLNYLKAFSTCFNLCFSPASGASTAAALFCIACTSALSSWMTLSCSSSLSSRSCYPSFVLLFAPLLPLF